MSAGVYAITVDDQIVYIGQSQCVFSRVQSHLRDIATGRAKGLAGRYPEVFKGRKPGYKVLLERPYVPRLPSREVVDRYFARQEFERNAILKHRPACNINYCKTAAWVHMTEKDVA